MDARLLEADDGDGLRAQAGEALAAGAGAVLVGDGPLGDPVVLAAGVSAWVPELLVGVRTSLETGAHPAVVARELTTLDLVCGGRAVLCVAPPSGGDEVLHEAIALCRTLWREGVAEGGRCFPVVRAVNRPGPATSRSPRVALDLAAGGQVDPRLADVLDLVLLPTGDPRTLRLEPV